MLCFRKTPVATKNIWIRRGGVESRVAVEKFCVTVPKNSVGVHFSVSLISSIENFCASEGYVTNKCGVFLSQSAEKFRRGIL